MADCKDIVWTTYPFTGQNASKHRPAVLISGKNSYGDFICLPITSSQIQNYFSLETSHILGGADLSLLRILTSSRVSLEQPMTLKSHLIDDTPIATLTDAAFQTIKNKLFDESCC